MIGGYTTYPHAGYRVSSSSATRLDGSRNRCSPAYEANLCRPTPSAPQSRSPPAVSTPRPPNFARVFRLRASETLPSCRSTPTIYTVFVGFYGRVASFRGDGGYSERRSARGAVRCPGGVPKDSFSDAVFASDSNATWKARNREKGLLIHR